jgi:hypothetical protein
VGRRAREHAQHAEEFSAGDARPVVRHPARVASTPSSATAKRSRRRISRRASVSSQCPAATTSTPMASLVASLDLVISVDTSLAHLAGALGKRVFVLLAYVADWRWMLGRADNPWYPAARLFRPAGDRRLVVRDRLSARRGARGSPLARRSAPGHRRCDRCSRRSCGTARADTTHRWHIAPPWRT